MKRLILILLPVLAFAQDTTRTFYFAAPTSYRTMAECISGGLYDNASAPRNPTGYPTSGAGDDNYIPIEKIPWSSITHLVLFSNQGNVSQTAPYFEFAFEGYQKSKSEYMYRWETDEETDPNNFNWMKMFIDTAHAHNVKILTIIQAVTPRNLNYVTDDSARTALFVDSVMSFITTWGFDGVSLNWEGTINQDTAEVGRLIRMLGQRLDDDMEPDGIFEMAPTPTSWDDYPPNATNQYVDLIHPQEYAFNWPYDSRWESAGNWWVCPIINNGWDQNNYMAVNTHGPAQWEEAGHNKNIVGVLFPALGFRSYGQSSFVTGPWDETGNLNLPYCDIVTYRNAGGVDTVDNTAHGFAVHGTSTSAIAGDNAVRNVPDDTPFWATWMDSSSTAYGVQWSLDSGYTHFAAFSLTNDVAQTWHSYFLAQFDSINQGGTTSYSITSATMTEGTVGAAYADTLVGTSPVTADYRILIRGLPPGLWLKWDGVIQGTPTTAGTYTPTVRIQARNTRAKQAWEQISITINAE